MRKLKQNLIILFAILIAIGPISKLTTIETETNGSASSCCQSNDNNCCCSVPDDQSSDGSDESENCHCEISPPSTTPVEPFDVQIVRSDYKYINPQIESYGSLKELTHSTQSVVLDKSPPLGKSLPAFIQFGALLI
jgi:hypothetical protein